MLKSISVFLLAVLFSLPLQANEKSKDVPVEMTPEQEKAYLEKMLNTGSATDRRILATLESSRNPFALMPYEQNYILYTFTDGINRSAYQALDPAFANQLDDHEIKFQVSLMFPIAKGVLGRNSALVASYTQMSQWQALNSDISAPFRETNYEPQVFVAWLTDWKLLGFKLRMVEAGFNHQSNGRGEALSRSWNRLFANFLFEKENLSVNFKPYIRLQESIEEDDNPNIEDYLGNHRLDLAYKSGEDVFTYRTRYSFKGNRGSLEIGWSRQITPKVRLYAQAFTGYGESLIDYNHNQTRIGIGFMLNDLL